ncbi:DUF6602 domain-containing protein [Acinetobacter soli]|uniref:DUF6602 domain-containing protein n=1 Tax=Acinetobacter soli TaxID=487316 RepID=UPI0012506081|nr:DUF6602 domain-containing protein [Acinetobacter soli]
MSIISEKFNAKITSIKEEFKINKDVGHQGIKGGLNEGEFSNLISEIIPKKFKLSRGIIENAQGEQSNETDFFIYDDEILPPYIKKDLAFIPVEATKYVFEIKSILNSTELKTTISKFSKYVDLGGRAPTVLFSFSTDIHGSELDRYRKNDANFYTYPEIMVLCISDKSYYFKMVEEKYLIEILPIDEFIKNSKKDEDFKLKVGDTTISFDNLKQTNLTINSDSLNLNGIDYSKIKYKIHRWFGIENAGNIIELSLLSGISNTLCKETFGKYLLHGKDPNFKVFSMCFEDMWGNISCQDFDPNGLSYNLTDIEFNFSTSRENHKLLFNLKSN